jgi:deoxyhypusine monooxygenase
MSLNVSAEQLVSLSDSLLNPKTPLHKRFRALFALKAIGGSEAISAISKGFDDDSALLRHEFAYVLGQMKDQRAIPKLEQVLSDEEEDPMVRHEVSSRKSHVQSTALNQYRYRAKAAEALGAIGSPSSLPMLIKYSADTQDVVRETCQIAIDRIKWENSPEVKLPTVTSAFASIDPAPSKPSQGGEESIEKLKAQLMDSSLSLFKRYRAMFSLRNRGTPEAIDALASGFSDPSALFRYVMLYLGPF